MYSYFIIKGKMKFGGSHDYIINKNYIELGILAVFLLVVLYIILLVSISGMRKKIQEIHVRKKRSITRAIST